MTTNQSHSGSQKRDEAYLDTLTKEYERVCVEIRMLEATNEKIVSFAIAFLTTGFSYGSTTAGSAAMTSGVPSGMVFFFIGIGFTCVFIYATMQYYRVLRYGGYKKFLEERINDAVNQRALFWEVLVSQDKKSDIINNALYFGYGVVAIFAEGYCIWFINTRYDLIWSAIFNVVMVILWILLARSLQQMQKAFRSAYEAAAVLVNGPPNEPGPTTLLHSG